MKIATKMAIAIASLVALMVVTMLIGFWQLGDMAGRVEQIINDDAKEERIVWDWYSETKANAVRALVLARSGDEDVKKLLAPTLEETTKRISILQKQVETLISTPEAKAIFAEVGEKRQLYVAARTAALNARKAGNNDEANKLVDTRMVPAISDYVGTLNKMVAYQKSALEGSGTAIVASTSSGRVIYLIAMLISFAIGTAIMWWLRRAILGPLTGAVRVAQTVADGDLTAQIDTRSDDEAGQLMRALDTMNKNLTGIVREVRNGTVKIMLASREIATSNSDLSGRTEAQASSLEETASAIEELTSTVKANANSAREAANYVAGASTVAQKGGTMVAEVVDTMADITESARKISAIIGVIDGIAFQTNILALNAAVEAARAGEQGRGFAVVAAEVRSLAQRTATSAKEIKALIGESGDRVETGARLVEETGRTMQEIVDSVARVNEIISQIALSSQEQSSGIEQVNKAITQMENTTQQNAALVEEAAATAEQLAAQAEELERVVGNFKLTAESAHDTPDREFKPLSPIAPTGKTAARKAEVRGALMVRPGRAPQLREPRFSGDADEKDWKEF